MCGTDGGDGGSGGGGSGKRYSEDHGCDWVLCDGSGDVCGIGKAYGDTGITGRCAPGGRLGGGRRFDGLSRIEVDVVNKSRVSGKNSM